MLAGGFLSEKYLGVPADKVKLDTSSKGKYGRVIAERGGWTWFQELLRALDGVAKKHQSSISNVAARWMGVQPRHCRQSCSLCREYQRLRPCWPSTTSSPPLAANRWVLDRPGVAGVILGARNADHLPDHLALFSLALDDTDRGKISEVLAKGKRPRGDSYQWERGIGPF